MEGDHDLLFVSASSGSAQNPFDKTLGLVLDSRSKKVVSVGHYDSAMKLQGIGLHTNKHGQTFVGLFKDSMCIK